MSTNKPMQGYKLTSIIIKTMSVIPLYLNPTLQFFIQVYAAEV